VVGSAGTVNTGAIDDLVSLSELATEEDLWFHVDGAFGALVSLVPEERYRVKGLEQADSLAFDMHKWLSIPYEIGVALIQHHEEHRNTFYLRPDYLSQTSRGLASFKDWPTDFGIELSRGFRALKAWMVIKEQGVDKYAQVLKKNMKQAQYLAERVQLEDQLQLLAPVSLNIVCFRFIEPSLDEPHLAQLNEEIMFRLQESGIAVISHTLLQGKFSLRAAIVNHRSQFVDFDILVDEVLRLGRQILAEIH
jgi:glutamate/tyrosine decarboxylase-like PLP-dependent enzyme